MYNINELRELIQQCDNFIKDSHITVRKFCALAGISYQSYYDWINGKSMPYERTIEKLKHFLSSKKAQLLLEDGRKYPNISDCMRITGLKHPVIKRLCDDGVIDCIRSTGNHIRPNIDQLRAYANLQNPGRIYFKSAKNTRMLAFKDLQLDPEEVWKPMLSQNNENEIFMLDRHEYVNQYWISNKGHIYNATTRNILGAKPDRNKYITVNLEKFDEDGNIVLVTRLIHRLVAYFFAPHEDLFRDEVHHINRKKQDNRASNLLWCTPEEHDECHRLMKKNKKAYRAYVNKIKRENRGNRGKANHI